LPIVVIGNVLVPEHGYAIASQAISVHTTAPKVAPKPCFGHSTVFGGEEGRVTIESKSATDAIDRKQQSARDL
jgi:hypothetical protein